MVSFAKAGAYTAWTVVALVAAAARPASADILDRFQFPETVTESQPATPATPDRDAVFDEAYSFADEDGSTLDSGAGLDAADEVVTEGRTEPEQNQASLDEAVRLTGTWAWEGLVEGIPTYVETTFYPNGTYESYAVNAFLDLYEAGSWSLANGVLRAEVAEYFPSMIQTPYGPQPIEIEPLYQTQLSFLDDNTVETDIGLSYRVD